jgi:RNA polymerase sigma-70 factor (ECF subfamily)
METDKWHGNAPPNRNGDAEGMELLQRIAGKDRAAFRAFYDLYAQRLGNFLLKQLKNPQWVDEAVNDVMLVVWQTAGEFDPSRSRLSTWLFGIAHNKGLKLLEKSRRHWREQTLETPIESDFDDNALDDEGALEQSDPDNP